MIFLAVPAPTPSSFMSSVCVASLMLTLPSLEAGDFASLRACFVSDASTPPAAPAPHIIAATATIHLNVVIRASRESVHCWRRFDSGRDGLTMPTIRDSGAYLLGFGRGDTLEIHFPLPRQHGFLRRVALLAGGNDIAANRSPATNQRHHMVEREASRANRPVAIVTAAVGNPPLPPSRLAQLARKRLLASDARRLAPRHVALPCGHAPSVAAPSCSDSSSHSFMSQATFCSASLRACAISRARSPSR